jgi:glutamate-1-semialdehyde 2,1-aminomutase
MKEATKAGLAGRARAVIPGGVNSRQRQIEGLEELVIVSTEGATFTDAEGRTYVDYHAAYGPPLLGHRDPDVDRAVLSTLQELDHPGIGVTPIEIEAAERLVDHVPSFERVLLVSGGSEATYHAVRLARAATGRRHIVKFQGCYHGWHDAVAMNVISPPERVGQKDPLSAGMFPEVVDATLVVPFNDLGAVEQAFEAHADDVAAVILEPIQHNIGAVLPQPGFLEGLRDICDREGALLVFDEVVTGFRHGLGGYQAIAGVIPDVTTIGKSMANGYPVGAVGGRADLMELFAQPDTPVFSAGTFNGHPAVAAAIVATLDKLEREPVHEHIFALGERTRRGLTALFESMGVPALVAGFGSIFVTYFLEPPVESYTDLLRNDADLFVGYRRELIKAGIFELPLNLKRNHFSYAHEDKHVDQLLEATERAVRTVLERGY